VNIQSFYRSTPNLQLPLYRCKVTVLERHFTLK
jgi:hypothetical protein